MMERRQQPHMPRGEEPPKQAYRVGVGYCEHGFVHLNLFDEYGEVFAVAPLPSATALAIAGAIHKAVDAVNAGSGKVKH